MLPLLLILGLLAMPVVEIIVILQIGQVIGVLPTVLLLLFESVLGAVILKREGRHAWRAVRETFDKGQMPDRELADAALVLVGGTLLLTPGFVTDAFGTVLVLPFTRPLVRRLVTSLATRRIESRVRHYATASTYGPYDPGAAAAYDHGHRVVRGNVIHDDTA